MVKLPEAEVLHQVGFWASARTVNWGNGTAAVHSLKVHPDRRREGLAKQVMEKVCSYADENHLILLLLAESDEDIPQEALIRFYEGYDFVLQAGTKSSMVRAPR